jgi:hypothetical protein
VYEKWLCGGRIDNVERVYVKSLLETGEIMYREGTKRGIEETGDNIERGYVKELCGDRRDNV